MTSLLDFLGIESATFWALLAICLVLAEVLMTSGFFLSFAASAFVVATRVWYFSPSHLWDVLLFAVLGVLLIVPFRYSLRRYFDQTKDINDF
jgi:membrane protein implicated in regulation of membrane protease activity